MLRCVQIVQLFRQNQYITQHEQQRGYANTSTGDTALMSEVWNVLLCHPLCLVLWRYQGRNHGWKVEGDQGLGPAPGQRPVWVLGAGGGRPFRCEGLGVSTPPRKFLKTYAKSCILVTTCREISCFLKPTAKKLGHQYTIGRLGDQSPPVPTVVAPMDVMARYTTCILSLCNNWSTNLLSNWLAYNERRRQRTILNKSIAMCNTAKLHRPIMPNVIESNVDF